MKESFGNFLIKKLEGIIEKYKILKLPNIHLIHYHLKPPIQNNHTHSKKITVYVLTCFRTNSENDNADDDGDGK